MPDVQNTLTFTPDGSLDIGAAAASRPRDLYLGNNGTVGGSLAIAATPSTSEGISLGSAGLTGTSPFGARLRPRFPSTATSSPKVAELEFGTAAAAFTASLGAALNIATPVIGAGSAVTTHRGILIANQGNAGIANAYGIFITNPTGATTLNIGLFNAGRTRLDNHLDWNTDNTYDIGASGANRPRDLYLAGALNVAGSVSLPTGAITSAMIADGTIAAADIASGQITDAGASQLSSLTTSSSTATQLTGGSITLDMGTTGGRIMVWAFGIAKYNSTSGRAQMSVRLDGASEVSMLRPDATNFYNMQGGCWVYPGVGSGNHTVTCWVKAFDSQSITFDSGFFVAVGLKR